MGDYVLLNKEIVQRILEHIARTYDGSNEDEIRIVEDLRAALAQPIPAKNPAK